MLLLVTLKRAAIFSLMAHDLAKIKKNVTGRRLKAKIALKDGKMTLLIVFGKRVGSKMFVYFYIFYR